MGFLSILLFLLSSSLLFVVLLSYGGGLDTNLARPNLVDWVKPIKFIVF